eukprot:jgi/Bigna1/87300/estExt_fgenesh1_pg.C_180218
MPAKAASHPTFSIMVCEAVNELTAPRKPVSRQSIKKYIMENYKGLGADTQYDRFMGRLRLAIRRLVASDALIAVTKGSFKLSDKGKKNVTKKAAPKKKGKTTSKKKTTTKKKSATKKAAPKKKASSKKKTTKKSAKKKTSKTGAKKK